MSYTYIIIEDNKGAVANLRMALKSYSEFSEVGHAPNTQEGLRLLLSERPHLIFLDVELGDDNGFDFLEEISQFSLNPPFIIMTTDHDKYAREAVNKDVFYFLDKPIDPSELEIALNKFQIHFPKLQNQLIIKRSEGHFFIDYEDILYISSDNNYCNIHIVDSKPMLVSRTLKDIGATLPEAFIRIHRSYIVNSDYVHMMNTTQKSIGLSCKTGDELKKLPIGGQYLDKVRHLLLAK